MRFAGKITATAAILVVAAVAVWYVLVRPGARLESGIDPATRASAQGAGAPSTAAAEPDSVNLSDSQLASVKVEAVGDREVPIDKPPRRRIAFHAHLPLPLFPPSPA